MPKMHRQAYQLASYVNPEIWKRVGKLTKKHPRWSISRIGGECIERALPELEKELEQRTQA